MKLPRDEAHIWLATDVVSEDELNAYASVLDEAEASRAGRFHFAADRRRFVVAHGLHRMILGVYGCGQPASLRIARRCALCGSADHGKPYLVLPTGEPARLRFSISYSDGLVALAFSHGREIGVDVEARSAGWREIAGHVFSSAERRSLESLEGDSARRSFYRVWTRKEAVSKISGQGLSQVADLDTCSWTYLEGGVFEAPATSSEVPWVGRDLDLKDPHFGAVAAQGRVRTFRSFRTSHREILETPATDSVAPKRYLARAVRQGIG